MRREDLPVGATPGPAVGGLRSLCVFCGSTAGADPVFASAARRLGRTVADRGMTLVYGGGHVGLMGEVADAALAAGGRVVGVITRALQAREVAHGGLTELHVVDTMHQRKAAMADMADAFMALPGGFGTWDELFEAVTWTQLGIHDKPCALLDVAGYYAPLAALVDAATRQRFVPDADHRVLLVGEDAVELLDRMARWRAPATGGRLGPDDR